MQDPPGRRSDGSPAPEGKGAAPEGKPEDAATGKADGEGAGKVQGEGDRAAANGGREQGAAVGPPRVATVDDLRSLRRWVLVASVWAVAATAIAVIALVVANRFDEEEQNARTAGQITQVQKQLREPHRRSRVTHRRPSDLGGRLGPRQPAGEGRGPRRHDIRPDRPPERPAGRPRAAGRGPRADRDQRTDRHGGEPAVVPSGWLLNARGAAPQKRGAPSRTPLGLVC